MSEAEISGLYEAIGRLEVRNRELEADVSLWRRRCQERVSRWRGYRDDMQRNAEGLDGQLVVRRELLLPTPSGLFLNLKGWPLQRLM
jgi:hypothetical protein